MRGSAESPRPSSSSTFVPKESPYGAGDSPTQPVACPYWLGAPGVARSSAPIIPWWSNVLLQSAGIRRQLDSYSPCPCGLPLVQVNYLISARPALLLRMSLSSARTVCKTSWRYLLFQAAREVALESGRVLVELWMAVSVLDGFHSQQQTGHCNWHKVYGFYSDISRALDLFRWKVPGKDIAGQCFKWDFLIPT